jgi:hypothetical protein
MRVIQPHCSAKLLPRVARLSCTPSEAKSVSTADVELAMVLSTVAAGAAFCSMGAGAALTEAQRLAMTAITKVMRANILMAFEIVDFNLSQLC